MLKRKDIADIFKVGIILFLITAAAALILAAVNGFTAPVIAENDRKTQEAAMQKVLPAATEFTKVEFTPEPGSAVTEIYSGGEAGVVVKASPNGYGGAVSMIVGLDAENKVTGLEIISQSETAGLGANCTREDFRAQFVGKTSGIEVVKGNASGNQIDAITSATITSRAVTKGVNEAAETVREMRGEN